VNSPNPALVSQREAEPLPRFLLLLFCAAYVLPGVFGRDPWKSADITAFGYIVNIAHGKTSWFAPTVGGLPTADGALLPYWIGAVFVKALPWLDATLAARIPFALLLGLTLALTWYAAYWLARTDSAQPLPFAFGGEAAPADYARAIADGALLAVIASLGLLQLGHETTPDLAQLAAISLYLYGLAASYRRPLKGGLAAGLALPALVASGAPSIALLLAGVGMAITLAARRPGWARQAAFIATGAALAVLAASLLGAWANRLGTYRHGGQVFSLLSEIAWFAWPTWPLAIFTVWTWRRRLLDEHLAMPLGCTLMLLAIWIGMGGSNRALMLALPPFALLAAFALPTLRRSAAAAIDWFSVFFFTIAAATGWAFYIAMQTGEPAKLAANVAKLSPGYENVFSPVALAFALAATIAWAWLVKWRTGRNRHPIWKSMVLPAGGVTLCLVLVMTVLLPPFDNARSYRSMVQRVARQIPASACLSTPGMSRAQIVALESQGGWKVDAVTPPSRSTCEFLILPRQRKPPDASWLFMARERRVRSEDDIIDIYRRAETRRR
jgi:4-amino-4-deoxy-L-arabinose transferase-like glycosyltransferase